MNNSSFKFTISSNKNMEMEIDKKIVRDLRNWFTSYVKTFKYDNNELQRNIDIKREHTERVTEEIQNLILCSIRYHNQASLPREETKTCLFYSRLIRDADKLDIWRVITDYYHRKNGRRNVALELELPDTPGISKEVYRALMNRQSVEMKHVKNINDIKLLQAGWVYDINSQGIQTAASCGEGTRLSGGRHLTMLLINTCSSRVNPQAAILMRSVPKSKKISSVAGKYYVRVQR